MRLPRRAVRVPKAEIIEPRAELDPRFSDPRAVATPWADTRRALEAAEIFWISSVRTDGRPHVTPLVAVWLDGALHFSTGADEQKMHNLRANPNLILTTGSDRWQEGLDVVVEGVAVRVDDDVALGRLAAVWATKWDGRWQWDAHDGSFHDDHGDALVFSVTPTKVLTFAKGPFGHTRYLF
jgi:nitroimidazol reductase NimA-like FMN-containing flavoprotein (pyridoxamine 5'-phosphate oxidase superfamily)